MPKVGMEPSRKEDTINATLECICEYGIDKITLDMVACKAGFSKGIISYYFKSKKHMIHESLKAFLSSYRLKTESTIRKDMQPLQIIKMVIESSLPPINDNNCDKLNVSILGGPEKINLPQAKIAAIFINLFSKAATDNELKSILIDDYSADIASISSLMLYAKKTYNIEEIDETKAAYSLLAMIYGLSFFRVVDFMLPGEIDNRDIAFDFIDILFRKQSNNS